MTEVLDKKGILSRLGEIAPVVLDLGCGPTRRHSGWIGVDRLDDEAVDLVGDVFEVLRRFPEGSVDEVRSSHFFEHVDDLPGLMAEIQRVLKKRGLLEVVVPHFSNPYFHSDYTHRRAFGLYTFSYLAKDEVLKVKVPDYRTGLEFEMESVKMIFRSPHRAGHMMKGWMGWLVNSSAWVQAFYEENLCYVWPCYEIRFTLRRR